MKKQKQALPHVPRYLYDHCRREWWPALDLHRQIRHFKKGEQIFSEGDPVRGVYFMIDGVVKVHKHWTDDKELIIRFATNNDIIGHRGLSSHSDKYPITATALSQVDACYIDMDFFYATLKVNPELMFDLMLFFADELQLSEQRMRDLAHRSVRSRVAGNLLALEKKFGVDPSGNIAFQISRQDIAAYTGAAYETVYKLLLEFEQAGLIRTSGRQIGILQRDALHAASLI